MKETVKTMKEEEQDMHRSDNAFVEFFFCMSLESSENSFNPFEHTGHALKEQIPNVCILNVLR